MPRMLYVMDIIEVLGGEHGFNLTMQSCKKAARAIKTH